MTAPAVRPPRPGWPWGTLLAFNLVVLPFALVGHHVGDTDTFYHLAGGRWMAEHGRVLDRETFSFTRAGEPWTNYYWLFQVVIFRLHEWGGFPALNALRAALVLTTLNLAFLASWRMSGSRLVTITVSLMALAVYAPRAGSLRPHLLSYLFLALAVLLLERLWRRPGRLAPWLPLLCVPWANLHGVEYPVVLLVVGAYGLAAVASRPRAPAAALLRDPDLRRWPVLLALCAAGFAVNPFGLELFRAAAIGWNQEAMSRIGEMRALGLADLLDFRPPLAIPSLGHITYFLLLAVAALPAWLRARDVRALLVVGVAAVLTAGKVRFAAELAVLGAGFVAGGLAGRLERSAGWSRRALAGALGAVAILIVVTAGRTTVDRWRAGAYQALSGAAYPVGAVAYLRHHGLDGRVFNDATMGGYLAWAAFPRLTVFMDMRTPEPFDARVSWLSQGVTQAGPEMSVAMLRRRWPIDLVLVRPEWPIARALRATPDSDFLLVYADGRFVVFATPALLGSRADSLALRRLDIDDPTLRYVDALGAVERVELHAELDRLLAVWDDNPLAHDTRLALFLADGRWAEARDAAARRVGEPQAGPYAAYVRAVALARLGRPAEAAQAFEALLARDPHFERALVGLAETGLQLGRAREARQAMERYLVARDYFLTGPEYALLGNARYQAGDRRASIEAYERALFLTPEPHPDRPVIETNLAGAYLDGDEAGRAAPLLEAALRRRPGFPEAEYTLARAWLRLGRDEEARRVFARLAGDESAPAAVRARARERLAR